MNAYQIRELTRALNTLKRHGVKLPDGLVPQPKPVRLKRAEVKRIEAALVTNDGVVVISKKKKMVKVWTLAGYTKMANLHRGNRWAKKAHTNGAKTEQPGLVAA